jgi:peptidoglycan/LPS O-acetylase OafA/YrhL
MVEVEAKREFRNEIQGLRATASVLIAVYHIWFNRVSGGVDVFFVVSGFLIIGSLTREVESKQRVALGAYYTRIARRIFPLAYVVLGVAIVGTWFFVSRVYWEDVFDGIRAASAYLANVFFASTSVEYLGQDANTSPVQHFWAMSIQGQFYLFAPLCIVSVAYMARRFGASARSFVVWMLLLVTLASFVYSVIATPLEPAPMYFNSFARVWEFGVGGLLALVAAQFTFSRRSAAVMAWVGAVVVFGNAAVIHDIAFPGYIALVPVAGAVLVVLAGQTAAPSMPIRVLGTKHLVRLGDYSYGFFLWHWPLLIFGKLHFNADSVSLLGGVAILLGALVLSGVTYHVVEAPFLRLRKGERKIPTAKEFAVLGVSLVLVLGATSVLQNQVSNDVNANDDATVVINAKPKAEVLANVVASQLFDPLLPLRPDPLVADDDRGQTRIDGCFLKDKSTSRVEICSYGDPNGPTVALVGGSHSLHWFSAVQAAAVTHKWDLQVIVKVTCRYEQIIDTSCGRWVGNTEQHLLDNPPDLVITTATIGSKRQERVPEGYLERWNVLSNANIPILAIRDTPWFPYSIPACVDANRSNPNICAMGRSELLLNVNPAIAATTGIKNMYLADFTDYLCDETLCYAVINNVVTYRDRDHLTSTFTSQLGTVMEEKLLEILPSGAQK